MIPIFGGIDISESSEKAQYLLGVSNYDDDEDKYGFLWVK